MYFQAHPMWAPSVPQQPLAVTSLEITQTQF
jgi:hypothetical protein